MNKQLEDQRKQVQELFGGRCALCYHSKSITVHEEPPRSLNPNWKSEPWTWYPLCNSCHDLAHTGSRAVFEVRLEASMLTNFPKVRAKLYELAKQFT